MRKLFISALSMLAVAMGFTACSSDDEFTSNSETSRLAKVYAITEQPSDTRATLGEDYSVVWEKGDEITIGGNVFTLVGDGGSSTGVFEGEAPADGTYSAYYNYDESNWPTNQTYVSGNITGAPMKATGINVSGNEISNISFKNVGGILRLNLKGTAKVASIKISATNLTNPITLNCGSTGVELNTTTATPFHIAVQGTDEGTAYSDLKIEITDNTGDVCTKTANKAITVQRSKITDITLTAGSFVVPPTTGTAKITGGFDMNWVQLWKNGPKFAEYNVGVNFSSVKKAGAIITFTEATKAGAEYVWGANWCTPSKADMEHLMKAAKGETDDKVTCIYTKEGGQYGFKFTGKTDGYTHNSVFFHTNSSRDDYCAARFWSATANGSNAWCMELYYDGKASSRKWSSDWYSCSQSNSYSVRPVFKN